MKQKPPHADAVAFARELAGAYRLAPPQAVAGGAAGAFAGRREGQSLDFHDYRQYLPGDDLRRVDWRAYARSGQMHLRLFREEVSPVVEIHLDTSASMAAYAGKEAAAVFAAAFLAETTAAAGGVPLLCAWGKRIGGADIDAALARAVFGGGAGEEETPSPGGLRPLRLFVSDCLWAEGAGERFRRRAAGSLHFLPLALLSRSEVDPPWRGLYRLRDVEDAAGDHELDLGVDDGAVALYRARLARHRETLENLARSHGGRLLWWETPDAACDRDELLRLAGLLARERVVMPR